MYKKTFLAIGAGADLISAKLIAAGWKESDTPYLLLVDKVDGETPENATMPTELTNKFTEASARCLTDNYMLHAQQRNIFPLTYEFIKFNYTGGVYIVRFAKYGEYSKHARIIDSIISWRGARAQFEREHGEMLLGIIAREIDIAPPLIQRKKFLLRAQLIIHEKFAEFSPQCQILLAKKDYVQTDWGSADIHCPTELGGIYPDDFEPKFYVPVINMQLAQIAVDLAFIAKNMEKYPHCFSAFMFFDVYLSMMKSSAVIVERVEESITTGENLDWKVSMIDKVVQSHGEK
jgi:hypothetical protein